MKIGITVNRAELKRIAAGIQSLVDIDSLMEQTEDVKLWKEQLKMATDLLATDAEIFEI